jgi:sec-independent protein translocase protein TatA
MNMNIGWGELLVIMAIALLIVGARRLPEIGHSLGRAIREFQDALRGPPQDHNKRSEHDTHANT